MRGRGMIATWIFGALAGAGWPAFALLAAPLLGAHTALSLYLLGAAVAYVAVIAPRGMRRARAVAVALPLAAAVGMAAPGVASVAAGAAGVVAVCRSGVARPRRRVGGIALEAVLAAGGLLLARWLAGPDPVGVGLAIWGYFLVQSVFFCVTPAPSGNTRVDPFDLAVRRAEELLEGDA